MPRSGFIHLRVHTDYSLSESAIRIKDLPRLAQEHGMPAIGITDVGNLFGAMEYCSTLSKAGIQPVVGCRLGLAREEAEGLNRSGRKPEPDAIVLYAASPRGYENLMALTSAGYLDTPAGETPRVTMQDLAAKAEGLICLTGGLAGTVGRLLSENQDAAARAALEKLARIYPGHLYVELQRHGLSEEAAIEERLIDLAYALDLPLVASNDCLFTDEDMHGAHDALICVAAGATVSATERRRVTPNHRFRSAAEMQELFADLPEAIDNTLVVARRCAVMAPERKPLLPRFTLPGAEAEDEPSTLRRMAHEGLARRLAAAPVQDPESYRVRLDYELDVIVKMGFPGYFLIVADFIQWAKRQGIPVGPGRGSGAGSVVAWALTITDLDPLRFGLLFERFLNPERVSMPDFDIDFCQDRRDEVIRYVQSRYGADRVAQIITFGTLQARAALRDVGRVLEMPFGQVDRICKMVPANPANPVTLQKALDTEPRLRYERDSDEAVGRLIDTAMKLEGLHRHASTHAAGVVIGDRPLTELVPLYRDPRSALPATQFNMKYVEGAGLVKFDFLGLKTLTVLEKTRLLLDRRGVRLDLGNLPLDDRPSYDMLSRGDTVGIFQLESQGMRDVVRNLKPDRLEDIVALVALYRPGPMENIPRFIACKHGQEEPDYLHPLLEPVLKETYGVIVYQEQVMQIAQILAGYSLGEADLLRRAMGKKIKAEMEAQRERFVKGAAEKNIDPERASYIFDLVDKFAGYGFNKSHAAAYALVAYQTAYLKANHPVEFIAASMTLDLSNTDKLAVFRQELRRLGIDLLPPDVNRSEVEFSVEHPKGPAGKGAVRYALAAVRNVGAGAVDGLVRNRLADGLFRGIADFARRMDPQSLNKRMVENLGKAGAFDGLDRNRRRIVEGADVIIRQAAAAADARESRQVSLFGGDSAPEPPLPLPQVPDWDDLQRLEQEFSAIGFYLSAHPLDAYARSLKKLAVMRYADLVRGLDRNAVAKVAGIVMSRQERTSQRGSRFAYVQLSDPSGTFEAVVFSEALASAREHLEPGKAVVLSVEARPDGESARLTAKSVEALDKVADTAADGVVVHIRDAAPITGIRSLLERVKKPAARGRVSLMLRLPGEGSEIEVLLPGGYSITREVRAALKQVNGVDLVEER